MTSAIVGNHALILDLTAVFLAGFLGALAARTVRLPSIVGYLLAGLALGPSGVRLIADPARVEELAEFGVVLLMFAIGIELSVRVLFRTRGASLVAAPLQLALSVALGYAMGRALGWGSPQSVVLGFSLSLSSTMVVARLLAARGDLHTRPGEAMVAILLVQDLAAVVMVAMLPALTASSRNEAEDLLLLALKGLAFLVWAFVLARWIVPAVTRFVAREYSREVFVLLVAVLCFGGAVSSYLLGFSLALGAFLGGLVVSESHYSHELLSHVVPLRDLFGMVFFVSLGLSVDLHVLGDHPAWLGALLAAALIGKPLLTVLGLRAGRYPRGAALFAGLGLGQIGEFSFLIAIQARQAGLLSREMHAVLIAVAVLSLLATPALMAMGRRLARRSEADERALPEETALAPLEAGLPVRDHVILCGYGRVGRLVGEGLRAAGRPLVVIEYDAYLVSELRAQGLPALYGDASHPMLLAAAGAERARSAVVALPEGANTRLAVSALRRANPSLPIVARAHFASEAADIRAEGAEWVVYAEQEAGLEMLRHTLLGLGEEPPEVQTQLDQLRRRGEAELAEDDESPDFAD